MTLTELAPSIATRFQYQLYPNLSTPLTQIMCSRAPTYLVSPHANTQPVSPIHRSALAEANIACVKKLVQSRKRARLLLDWKSEPLYADDLKKLPN